MWSIKTLWGRIAGAPAKPLDLPEPQPLTRVEELREDRVRRTMERGMFALAARPKGMTDKDRLIFGRQIVAMMAASIG